MCVHTLNSQLCCFACVRVVVVSARVAACGVCTHAGCWLHGADGVLSAHCSLLHCIFLEISTHSLAFNN